MREMWVYCGNQFGPWGLRTELLDTLTCPIWKCRLLTRSSADSWPTVLPFTTGNLLKSVEISSAKRYRRLQRSEELPFRFLTRLGWERSIISLEFSTSWCQFWGCCLPFFLIVVELHDLPQTSKCKTLTPGIAYIHGEPYKYPTGRAVLKCERSPYWNDAGRTPEAANSKTSELGKFCGAKNWYVGNTWDWPSHIWCRVPAWTRRESDGFSQAK